MARATVTVLMLLLTGVVSGAVPAAGSEQPSARALVQGMIDLTRGASSYAELAMAIHRPDWERRSELRGWTRGRESALIRFTAPPKDEGNATLKMGEQMWTYTPRLNRVVRLPYSMMSQSWAGSDFSYNDLSRSDNLLRHYDHELMGASHRGAHTVYTLESVPHAEAPVVWGKQRLKVRDDHVLLEEVFYDQDGQPVKRLEALEVGSLGGRTFATRMRMTDLESADHWTELTYQAADFNVDVSDRRFSLFALRNPDF